MNSAADTLPASLWDGCLNARDTGGYPTREGGITRYGVLFRSDNLCRLTAAGLNRFAASGVETVIDVRSAYELDIDASPFAESDTVRYLNLPLQNEDDAVAMGRINSDIRLPDMYRVMVQHFGANIAAIVQAVAEAEGAVVVHCHAGKDRTGLVVALLLAAVGVADEVIAADYAVSGHYLGEARRVALLAAAEPGAREQLEHKLGAERETMVRVLAWLTDAYGGAEAYLLQAGIPAGVLSKLRGRLVSSSP